LGDGAGTFDAGVSYATGARPRSIEATDLNNDGILDLITANDGDGVDANASATVLFGNGDGTFALGGSYDTGLAAIGVATGDFNGDGFVDFLTADFADGTISLFEGVGGGDFSARTVVASGITSVYDIAVADFDKDGTQDFAVVQTAAGLSKLHAFAGGGDGSFSLTASYALGAGASYLDKGDLNNDGATDLVAVASTSNQVLSFIGTGSGTFQSAITTNGSGSLDAVKIADLNGDGNQDVVTTNFTANSLSIFYGQGGGTLSVATTVATGAAPHGVGLADFNNDTVLDIISSNSTSNNVSLLISNTTTGIGSIAPFTLRTAAEAYQAIDILERKATALDVQQGAIMGYYKRVESAIYTNDDVAKINLIASDRIMKIDRAEERAAIVRNQTILDRSSVALVHGDVNEQLLLSLLDDGEEG
jgi:hypothetical protein